MLKDFLIVGAGSFFGGGARFVGADAYRPALPARHIRRKRRGMPADRHLLGAELWRRIHDTDDETVAYDGLLRRLYHVLYLRERRHSTG